MMSQYKMMIMIDEGDFEHLLNCLANQRFIHEQLPETQAEWQETIDTAWNKGMQTLIRYKHSVGLCNNDQRHMDNTAAHND